MLSRRVEEKSRGTQRRGGRDRKRITRWIVSSPSSFSVFAAGLSAATVQHLIAEAGVKGALPEVVDLARLKLWGCGVGCGG